jgi:signal transduction histidine kinase
LDERAASELVPELLALVAHDLRNPLSALRSNLGFIGSVVERVDQDAREAVADAMVSCDGLAQIIDNLEVVIFALNQTRAPELGAVLLTQAVGESVSACRSMARSHGVDLNLDPGVAALGVTVRSHHEMLVRALSNVIRNAIQHGGESPVRVSAVSTAKTAKIRVADGGTPLDPAAKPSPFTPAGQLASKHSHQGRYGRGLGLWCASVTAVAAGATLSSSAGKVEGERNVFELEVALY